MKLLLLFILSAVFGQIDKSEGSEDFLSYSTWSNSLQYYKGEDLSYSYSYSLNHHVSRKMLRTEHNQLSSPTSYSFSSDHAEVITQHLSYSFPISLPPRAKAAVGLSFSMSYS